MSDINEVIIQGNLCKDPEVRDSATPLVSLRIATNSSFRDDAGEWQSKPNYINVTCFKNQAEYAVKNLHKGSLVVVVGRLEQHIYEAKDGSGKRESYTINARVLRHFEYPPREAADPEPAVEEKVPF